MSASLEVSSKSIRNFSPVPLDQLTEEDMKCLLRSVELDKDCNFDEVREQILSGNAVPWRYVTPGGTSLLLIQEKENKDEKYLYIWHMGGEGMLGHASFAVESLVSYAKLRGCKSLKSSSIPTAARYLKRFGFKPEMISLRKEI